MRLILGFQRQWKQRDKIKTLLLTSEFCTRKFVVQVLVWIYTANAAPKLHNRLTHRTQSSFDSLSFVSLIFI